MTVADAKDSAHLSSHAVEPSSLPLPVVSLAGEPQEIARTIRQAGMEHGFWYVSDHGVPQSLIDAAFSASKEFFQLPVEEKQKLKADEKARGWVGVGEYTLGREDQKRGDTKEMMGVWTPDLPEDSEEAKLPFHGANKWPDPKLAPNFKPVINEYLHALAKLADRLVRLIALSLDLPETHFDAFMEDALREVVCIRYTPERSDESEGVLGCGAHSDWAFGTLLIGDGSPGLQIRYKGKWMDVPTLPGLFVFNVADMLARWTNDTYTSTVHRVISQTGYDRYSLAWFLAPRHDAKVECLPTCNPEKAKYEPTHCAEYLTQKYMAAVEGSNKSAVKAQ